MTHAPVAPALVVRGPDSLPALVPHLVGFHPASSLVVLGLTAEQHTVRVTLRVDLPHPTDHVVDVVEAWSPSLAALPRSGALEAVLVLYPGVEHDPWGSGPGRDLPFRGLVDEVAAELRDAGVVALDAVCVVGERLRSYWCRDGACCPEEGRLVDPGEALRIRSVLVGQGSAPLRSRQDLVRALAERDAADPVRVAVEEAAEEAADSAAVPRPSGTEQQVERLVAGLRGLADDPRDPTGLPGLVAQAVRLCARVPSRDLLLRTLTVDPDPDVVGAARTVLGEAVRCASGRAAAPAAAVLAVCCWVAGDGAAARVSLDRALDADPSYSLAALVAAALDTGAPPWTWVEMMGEVSVESILGVDRSDPEDV